MAADDCSSVVGVPSPPSVLAVEARGPDEEHAAARSTTATTPTRRARTGRGYVVWASAVRGIPTDVVGSRTMTRRPLLTEVAAIVDGTHGNPHAFLGHHSG